MRDFKTIPRNYLLAGIGALIVILLAVTLIQPSGFKFEDATDYESRQKQAELDRQQYNELLASLELNQKGSEVALKKIATEEVVADEINTAFQIDKPVVIPQVSDRDIKIAEASGENELSQYFTDTANLIQGYNEQNKLAQQTVYTDFQDTKTLAKATESTDRTVVDLKNMTVPKEAVSYHKAQIIAMSQYADFLNDAKEYNTTATVTNQFNPRGEGSNEPWPKVYRNYAVINHEAQIMNEEISRIDQKYGIATQPYVYTPSTISPLSVKLGLVKEANAFLGFGDLSITIGDIPSLILEAVKESIVKAFSQFLISAIDKLVAKIDKYFAISSQLYYSQELGKLYTKEYWTKFDVSQADQTILKNFLPEYFCVPQTKEQAQQLLQVYKAKSEKLLKYDIQTVALDSPNFYDALAELGNAAQVSPELYWQDSFTALASQTKTASQDAATKEVTSPGLKSGRDLVSGSIDKTLSKILNVQDSQIQGAVNLGTSNADKIISLLISTVINSLTTKFIFTPLANATGVGGGQLAVVEEQSLCLSNAKYKPVVPGEISADDQQAINSAEIQACKDTFKATESINTADLPQSPILADCQRILGYPPGQNSHPTGSPPATPR